MKDEVEISGFKDIYQFFMMAKARKCCFYVSFGEAVDQTLADYRLQEVVYNSDKNQIPSNNDVTLMLEPIKEPDFVARIEAQDRLRVEFFYEGRIHYFDVQVGGISSSNGSVGFSAKLPDNVRTKQHREMLQLPAANDEQINMSIGGQKVDVIDVSGGGASVLIPQANLYDVDVGKAIKHIEIKVDGFQTKVSAEVRHMRSHADGLKLLVGLRFIFFRNHDEDDLLHLVKQKIASVSRQ